MRQLVRDREVDALTLRAVAQRRVEDVEGALQVSGWDIGSILLSGGSGHKTCRGSGGWRGGKPVALGDDDGAGGHAIMVPPNARP